MEYPNETSNFENFGFRIHQEQGVPLVDNYMMKNIELI